MSNSDTEPKRSRRSVVLYVFIILLSLVTVASLVSNYFFMEQLNTSTRQLYAQTALNSFGKTIIEKNGDLTCAKNIDEKTRNLFPQDKTGVTLFNDNGKMLSYSVETIRAEGGVSYVSFNIAGYHDSNCQTEMETVTHWVDECPLVAEKAFPDMTAQGFLKERIYRFSNDKEKKSLLLIPIENGCISIKKES